jgi:hypothetical protein
LADLLDAVARVAHRELGSAEDQGEYVARVESAADASRSASERIAAIGPQRSTALIEFDERLCPRLDALADALLELDPYQPTKQQFAAVTAAAGPLLRLEPHLLSLMIELAAAQSAEQAAAAVDGFLAAGAEL